MRFIIRMSLAVVASAASLALSWPYSRDFEYWAESPAMWLLHFGLGFLFAVVVFFLFFDSLGTMFEHEELGRASRAASVGAPLANMEDAS